jgi:hypothetical protein
LRLAQVLDRADGRDDASVSGNDRLEEVFLVNELEGPDGEVLRDLRIAEFGDRLVNIDALRLNPRVTKAGSISRAPYSSPSSAM